MERPERFSVRHGHTPAEKEVTVRDDAPDGLRYALLQFAYDLALTPFEVRKIICLVLHVAPSSSDWYGSPEREVATLVAECYWYQVYDIAEALYTALADYYRADFERELNAYFVAAGIGWKMAGGRIETRGEEVFELSLRAATDELNAAGLVTASNEIHEALQDLSRRPTSDLTGAMQHAAAALECVARESTGDSNATLGAILERYPGLVPRPLDVAVEKLWGYASENARHLREGTTPDREDAELLVGVAVAVATYLSKKRTRSL